MTDQDVQALKGELAFLRPKNTQWEPLSDQSFKLLFRPNTPEFDESPLGPEEARKLQEFKQYINELLSGALQLPNLSFFSGSGTSLGESRGPSMWDLWRKSMLAQPDAEGSQSHGLLSEEANEICSKVKYLERTHPNIEHFLSYCDAYLLFNDDASVRAFLVKTKKVILDACSNFIGSPDSNISAHENLLQKLARRRVRDPRLKIFTTNYDMCFEVAASELGMMVIDGFSYTRRRRFDGRYFNYDVVRRESDNHEFVEGVFQLYKLHGSVSWERKGCDIHEVSSPDPDNAALIYPTRGKYQQAFIQPYLELFSRFIEALRTPNNCVLITGFGFNDDHLSEPITSAIKSNPSLKLIVADYAAASNIEKSKINSEEVSPYWAELSELAENGYDINFINASFSEFVKLIPHLRALSPAEQLAKAIKQAGGLDDKK